MNICIVASADAYLTPCIKKYIRGFTAGFKKGIEVCVMANRVNLYCGKRVVSRDTKSWNILQWLIHLLWPHPHASGYFWKQIFFSSVFKKYASTRSVFKSFSPVHTKKLKRWKYQSIPFGACVMLEVYDLWHHHHLKTSIFTCPHVNEKPAFSKPHSGERFWKNVFSVTVFTRYVWMVGPTGDKNIYFQTKMDMCRCLQPMCCNSELGSTGMPL